MKYRSIAIDGPSGAGKSTIAKKLASDIGFIYVDTGAIYRSVALYDIENGIDLDNKDHVIENLPNIIIDISYDGDGLQRMFLCGRDVTDAIRMPEVSAGASKVSAIGQVREFLLEKQRDFAKRNNVIMDGRDIGTIVLPNADLKIYLTASAESRAERRYNELRGRGIDVSLDEVFRDMKIRDENDSRRAVAPLKKAADAVEVDTTHMSLDESYAAIKKIAEETLGI